MWSIPRSPSTEKKCSSAAPTSRVRAAPISAAVRQRSCEAPSSAVVGTAPVVGRWAVASFDPVESSTEGLGLRMSLRCACDPVPVVSALVQGGGRWALVSHYTEAVLTQFAADGAEPCPESD